MVQQRHFPSLSYNSCMLQATPEPPLLRPQTPTLAVTSITPCASLPHPDSLGQKKAGMGGIQPTCLMLTYKFPTNMKTLRGQTLFLFFSVYYKSLSF